MGKVIENRQEIEFMGGLYHRENFAFMPFNHWLRDNLWTVVAFPNKGPLMMYFVEATTSLEAIELCEEQLEEFYE